MSPAAAGGRCGRRAERGSAIVEFVLVAILLTGLLLGLVQLGIDLHVRNVLVASAAEGARYGANADRTPEDGAEYARRLIATALSARYAEGTVSADVEDAGGVAVVVVSVRTSLPLIFGWGRTASLDVRGRALRELP